MNFDYQGAKNEGYSDEEILSHLSKSRSDFDVNGAIKEGYSPEEISQYLTSEKKQEQSQKQPEEKSLLEKGGRLLGQFGMGALEAAALPYDIAVAPLSIPGGQETLGKLFTSEVLSDVYPQEAGESLAKDQGELAEPIKISSRDLIEKATGLDLKPEGILENIAHWTGFIKDPKKLYELGKTGLSSKEVIKAIAPTGKEALRGAGAGTALEIAKRGDFGPIGTLASLVIGDMTGGAVSSGISAVKKVITNPKESLAQLAKIFTNKDKLALQKDIIKDFRDSGIQADIGTLTDSDLVKWVQSRLAQSGLTGKALDDLKMTQTDQIKNQYKQIAESLGEAKYATSHEAGEVLKESVTKIRDQELSEARELYKQARNEIGESAHVNPERIAEKIKSIEKNLKPGNVKSAEQSSVLDILEKVKRDLYDSEGNLIYASVKDLINDKIALNEMINYEIQGGSKQLLKDVVAELDRTIISHGKENPAFARKYIQANKTFSEHAKTFRNKNVSNLLKTHDPSQMMNKFNNIQGIKDIHKILDKTPEGKEIFKELSRLKLDQVIGNNLVDSTTQQLKLGSFSKLLEKGKNRDIIKQILPETSFKRLENLQKSSGKLAESAQKFLNASKSGITLEDAGIVAKVLTDIGNVLIGNPWPIVRTGGTIAGARYLTRLMGDPNFLKLVEEAIIASETNNIPLMQKISKQISSPVKAAIIETSKNKLND
jgi:hypothetical protein